jgi:hypothetical protein
MWLDLSGDWDWDTVVLGLSGAFSPVVVDLSRDWDKDMRILYGLKKDGFR